MFSLTQDKNHRLKQYSRFNTVIDTIDQTYKIQVEIPFVLSAVTFFRSFCWDLFSAQKNVWWKESLFSFQRSSEVQAFDLVAVTPTSEKTWQVKKARFECRFVQRNITATDDHRSDFSKPA